MGFLMTLIFTLFGVCGVFLILIVLIQRGKGGGLAGAFGGMGGHSAFGTRAGDKLMRVTIGVAATWIILAMVSVRLTGSSTTTTRFPDTSGAVVEPRSSPDEAGDTPLLPGLSGDDLPGPLLGPAEGETPEQSTEGEASEETAQPPAQPVDSKVAAPGDASDPSRADDSARSPE